VHQTTAIQSELKQQLYLKISFTAWLLWLGDRIGAFVYAWRSQLATRLRFTMSACSRERHSLPLVGSCRIPPPLDSARHSFFSHMEYRSLHRRDNHSRFRRQIDRQPQQYQKPAHLEISIPGEVRTVNSEFVEQLPLPNCTVMAETNLRTCRQSS
jgi:hypothetical protein